MAAIMKMMTIAYRLYSIMKEGVIIPILVRKKATIGSSNMNPLASTIEVNVPI